MESNRNESNKLSPKASELLTKIRSTYEYYGWYEIQQLINSGNFTDNETYLLYSNMVSKSSDAFVLVPEPLKKNPKFLLMLFQHVRQLPNRIMSSIESNFKDRYLAGSYPDDDYYNIIKMYEAAINISNDALRDIPAQYITSEICMKVAKNGKLNFIPAHFLTPELCLLAVNKNPRSISSLAAHPHFLTKELILIAGKFNVSLLNNIPEEKVTVDLLIEIILSHYHLATDDEKIMRKQLEDILKKLQALYADKSIQAGTEFKSLVQFIISNRNKILSLYQIFGESAFYFLKSKLAGTPIPIERLFSFYAYLSDENIQSFSSIMKKIKNQPSKDETGKLAELFSLISTYPPDTVIKMIDKVNQKDFKNIKELINFMHEQCLIALIKELGINPNEVNFDNVKRKLPVDRLIQLAKGMAQLETQPERNELFVQMLKADLTIGHTFSQFANNTENNTTLGTNLAKHNLACVKELTENGINTELAFNYDKVKKITFGKSGHDFSNYQAIWNLISALEINAPGLLARTNLKKDIEKFKHELLKGSKDSPEALSNMTLQKIINNSNKILLNKIISTLKMLTDELDRVDKSRVNPTVQTSTPAQQEQDKLLKEYLPFLDEFKSTLNQLKKRFSSLQDPKDLNANTEKRVMEFHIEQWKKEDRLDTIFLGNDLSCCLATDGNYFTEILIRRMDKACFMHTVINEQSGEPVCGNWLFFARDSNDPSAVYVVANFFEIRKSYCLNPALRDLLVNSLSEFTKQFANDIGAKDFIIRPLTYGSIPNFNYDVVPMTIEKIGGFFNLETMETQTKNIYYLNALELNKFYKAPEISPQLALAQMDKPKEPATIAAHSQVSTLERQSLFSSQKERGTHTKPTVSAQENPTSIVSNNKK